MRGFKSCATREVGHIILLPRNAASHIAQWEQINENDKIAVERYIAFLLHEQAEKKLILHDQYKRSAQEVDAKSNFLRYFFI